MVVDDELKDVGFFFVKKLLVVINEVAGKSPDHVAGFGQVQHQLENKFSLSGNEVVALTGALRRAGLIEYVHDKGWRLLPPSAHEENADPLLAEFGDQCHGCAKFLCDKSKNGEPDGDCWEYERKEG